MHKSIYIFLLLKYVYWAVNNCNNNMHNRIYDWRCGHLTCSLLYILSVLSFSLFWWLLFLFCFVVVVAWLLLLFPFFIYSMYKHILCVQIVSMQSIAFAERKLIESTRYHLAVNKHCIICNGMPTISHIVRICMAICAYNNSKRPFELLNCKNRNMVLCHGKNYFDFTAIR